MGVGLSGMAKTEKKEKKDRSRPWQKAATRSAILSAARRLVERAGADSLTLSAVGREAGVAPTTVFAYFANKSELFLGIVTDDLADFARNEHVQTGSAAAEADAVTAEAECVECSPDDHDAVPRKNALDENGNERLQIAADPAASSEQRQAEATEVTSQATSDELARLQEAVTRLESRPVDAWLERRLREFERGLATIEAKQASADQTGPQIALEENVRLLTTRLETLEVRMAQATDERLPSICERLDTSRDQARQAISDNEVAHARIASRLDALENAAFAAAPAFFGPRPQPEAPAAHTGAVAESIVVPAQPTADAEDEAQPDSPRMFLSAARRSALEAQLRAEIEQPPPKTTHRLTRRTLYWIAGGLSLLVGFIWTGVYVKARELATMPAITMNAEAHEAVLSSRHGGLSAVSTRAAGSTQAGNAAAALMTGLTLLSGPHRNDAAAAKWLSLSAQQGNALAAFKLAILYRDGRGVSADASQAFRWNEVAAKAHNCDAMYSLAVSYAEGWGTAKDYGAAVRWFAQAASLGMTDSQFNLGVMYERGLGVPLNLADAYKWYLIAAAQGDRQAEQRVAALKPQLESGDLAAAEEAAAAFKVAPRDRAANEVPAVASASAS